MTGGRKLSPELETLVAELLKDRPSPSKLKMLTEGTGIAYQDNPSDLLASVLKVVDGLQVTKATKKRKPYETSL